MGSDRSFEKTAQDRMTVKKNTPDEIHQIIRVVCGAEAVRDGEDAKFLLDVIGICPRRGLNA